MSKSQVLTEQKEGKEHQTHASKTFEQDIISGLTSSPKSLPSKYLYDTRGDMLFQQIMDLPEYYLTRCEEEILRSIKEELLREVLARGRKFSLVELGAGDGTKTRLLLSHFLHMGADFRYMPVDISQHALNDLCSTLRAEYPSLAVQGFARDYFMALDDISASGDDLKLVLFMGGNIGNFSKEEATGFMRLLASRLNKGDLVLAGFDLKKDPSVIHRAYNDSQGVTRAFNFNLLRRINRELDADFDPDLFKHFPSYDPVNGAMKSYLVAEKPHTVNLRRPDTTISFAAWEPIFMEVSNKYTLAEVRRMASDAGLTTVETYMDKLGYYTNVLLSKP
jgi:L-histidine Nalpha-methyltransferase